MADKDMTEEIKELKHRLHECENDVKRFNLACQQTKEENEELLAQMEVLIKDNSSKMEVSMLLKLSENAFYDKTAHV